MQPLDNNSRKTPRAAWLRQVTEMHVLCKSLNVGFVWKYLWLNWYKLDKWSLWAWAATFNYHSIIQTNAPVEVHWNYLKNCVLHYFTHPRLDRLCYEIHKTSLLLMIVKIRQYRKGVKGCS